VYTAAQQGGQLIQQLSLFSTRKTIPQGLKTALRLVVDEEEKRLQKAWGQAIVLKVLVPSGLADVSIDVDSLRLVLGKLLDNAHEAINGTGTVTLSARPVRLTRADCLGLLGKACPGSYLEIAVADSGRGLSADGHKRIFVEPFYSTKPGHRGLGLVAVYGILHNYGGGIRLEDGAENGTLVRVYLPTLRRPDEATDGNRTGADGVLSSLQLCLATEGETRGKSSNG
jgi:signal transduction histidine kinase